MTDLTTLPIADIADIEALNASFTNQPPSPEQIERIEALRAEFKATGAHLVTSQGRSRFRSLAQTKLEEALMWAVKGIVLEDG